MDNQRLEINLDKINANRFDVLIELDNDVKDDAGGVESWDYLLYYVLSD